MVHCFEGKCAQTNVKEVELTCSSALLWLNLVCILSYLTNLQNSKYCIHVVVENEMTCASFLYTNSSHVHVLLCFAVEFCFV